MDRFSAGGGSVIEEKNLLVIRLWFEITFLLHSFIADYIKKYPK